MKTAADYHQEVLNWLDEFVHDDIDRREFLNRLSKYAVGGLTAAAIFESLLPAYAEATQVPEDDERLESSFIEYQSPRGHGSIRALMAKPAGAQGKLPGVVVVHENRGLNPHIEDVTRRAALAGFLALGPDALTPLGGYPGTDDEGRAMQRELDRNTILEDFVAAVEYLQSHPNCTGKVGIVGFCFGGWVSSMVPTRVADLAAAVPFYGPGPADEEVVARIQAPLQIHYAGLDERVNATWPAFKSALDAQGKEYEFHMYEGVNHGFHNDTTPRYDAEAAELAWQRTIAFFRQHLG